MIKAFIRAISLGLVLVCFSGHAEAQVIETTAIPAKLLASACQSLVAQKQQNLNYDDEADKKFDVVICRTYIRGYIDGIVASSQTTLPKCFTATKPALDEGLIAQEFVKLYKLSDAESSAANILKDVTLKVYCPSEKSEKK